MNTLWGPYKLSGATSLRIKERMAARQGDHRETDLDQGSGKRIHLSVLPTIAEHAGLELLSKSLAQELREPEWNKPARPASPDSILERAESDSPSSSATSDKSELEVEQQDAVDDSLETDLASPTSPLPGFGEKQVPAVKTEAKATIWSPAPVSVRPFCPEFWSSFTSPTQKPSPSVWASLDSPSSQPAGGLWTSLTSPPPQKSASPEPLPLSPISSPSSSPPPVILPSIFASVPNNAPISRSMQAARVPVLEREFSFKLGVTAAEPLPAASSKHFTRSLSLNAADGARTHPIGTDKLALDRSARPASAERALGKLSCFPSSPAVYQNGRTLHSPIHSPSTSPVVSPRSYGGTFNQGGTPPKKHHWCWRCGQRGDLATRCLVCSGDFAVCRGCAHERAAKGRRPDTCLCGGCMSRPIDPAVIERIQKMTRMNQAGGMQTGVGGPPDGSGQRGGDARHIPGAHAGPLRAR